MFAIHDDKSHYSSIKNILRKTLICEENIFQLYMARRFQKRSDLSFQDHKFDLIYCNWNTTEPGVVHNVGFLMFSL